MRLALPEKVLSLIGMNPVSQGSLKAAEDALDASFSEMEQAAECRLFFSTIKDTFTLVGAREPALRLTSGYLTNAVPVFSGTPVAVRHVLVKEGVVLLSGAPVGEVTIEYSCGFHDSGDGYTLIDVPYELEGAHAHLAASLMQLAPSAVPKTKAQAMGMDSAVGYSRKAYSILQGIARPRAMVIWPTSTEG